MDFDETFKILLVGDSGMWLRYEFSQLLGRMLTSFMLEPRKGVGKSSILLRFTDDVFESMQPTIGVDFKVKAMTVSNRTVKMTIWDT